jgi:hypothetical protein
MLLNFSHIVRIPLLLTVVVRSLWQRREVFGKDRISTRPDWPQIIVHHYTDERHRLGVTTINEGNNEFQIYDMEKTVVDVVYYREKVGIEETKEILVTYLQRKDRDLNRLLKYARLMKCDKIMRRYLEVLV